MYFSSIDKKLIYMDKSIVEESLQLNSKSMF